MRIRNALALPLLVLLASCYQFEVTAQGGFAQLALDGDLGYVNGSSSVSIQQDLESAFGLGDSQGSPYARVNLDMGVPNLGASAFMFKDSGQGTLTANFGNVPAGLTVLSDFELTSAKVSYTFEIPFGPVSIAPGIAVNFVDLSVFVRDAIGVASEDVNLQAPLPMAFARAEVDLGVVNLIGEGGYIQVDVEDINAKLLDLEAIVEFEAIGPLNLFAGYRLINLKGDGLVDGDAFDLDIGISGFMIGGGVTF